MGKRNRAKFLRPKSSPPHTYPSRPDGMPCSSGLNIVSEPLANNITENSLKLPNFRPSGPHHNYGLSRSLVLKQAQNQHYGHQCSLRKSNHHASTPSPYVKHFPVRDEKLPLKLPSQTIAEIHYQAEKLLKPANRIWLNPMEMETIPSNNPDTVKLPPCSICQKSLRQKPFSGASLSSSDISIVSVLVCGHLYHDQCLEQNTHGEHRHDPLCPLCSGMLSCTSSTVHIAPNSHT